MMEENKSQKASLVYAILGVAVLIVAVAGSTFAYFTAQATADEEISGEALDIALGVTLAPVSATGTKGSGLIPIFDGSVAKDDEDNTVTSQLQNAANATNQCVDKNGYTVCQVYEISITNTGTDSTTVDVTVNIDKKQLSNLKWANMTDLKTVGTTHDITSGDDAIVIEDVALTKDNTAANPVKKYIMVYVNNTGTAQTDKGDFTGRVTVTASTGDKVQAAF